MGGTSAGSTQGFRLLIGIVEATFMGMFVGRMKSRFLHVHNLEFVVLFAYAGIQPLFPFLSSAQESNKESVALVVIDMLIKVFACASKVGLARRQPADPERPAHPRSTCTRTVSWAPEYCGNGSTSNNTA